MKIALCIPAYQNQVHASLITGALNLFSSIKQHGDELQVYYIATALISYSRNYLMEVAKEADWVVMWDGDVEVGQFDVFYRLHKIAVENSAQVVGVLTRIKSQGAVEYACGFETQKGHERLKSKPNQPFELDFVAGGLHIIDNQWVRKNLSQPFYIIEDLPGPKILSEDWNFCKKVKQAGGKIMADPTIPVVHWGQFGWLS